MRALFVYKYLTIGGVEAVLRARMVGLAQFGIEARAWFLRDGPGRALFTGMAERYTVGGLPELQAELGREHYDFISTIDTEEVIPLLAMHADHTTLGLEVHTPYPENQLYLRRLGSYTPKVCLVPSEHQANVVRSVARTALPIQVVPNPVGEHFIESGPRALVTPPSPVMGWVGRLDHLKNWGMFLDVARRLLRRTAALEFWIVGSSNRAGIEQELYRRACRDSVLGNLRWFKRVAHGRLPAILDAVKLSGGILISTSRGESFGMTVAEAMARGCPVVVPHQAPFTEFIEDGKHGLLYRAGSVRSASMAVGRLLDDASLRATCGEAGRKLIVSRHSPSVALQSLAEVLHQVVAESSTNGRADHSRTVRRGRAG